eukprot:TRINITY_DN883_c0_g1_i4.p1 TRINITY_DN883_c0_g1~~TRINITY_DN883_c0_g1_i4.p1  ORF type:complete len:1753 (+),score=424.47 TRINITY_DN883_c0_g1_i4:201-5459(+)
MDVEGSSDPCLVELKIKTLDSRTFNIKVPKDVPVPMLKECIAAESNVPVENQRLICRGKVLKDEHRLSDYNVQDGHALHLVPRVPQQQQAGARGGVGGGARSTATAGGASGGAAGQNQGPSGQATPFGGSGVVLPMPMDANGLPDLNRIISSVLGSINLAGVLSGQGMGPEGADVTMSDGTDAGAGWGDGGGQAPHGVEVHIDTLYGMPTNMYAAMAGNGADGTTGGQPPHSHVVLRSSQVVGVPPNLLRHLQPQQDLPAQQSGAQPQQQQQRSQQQGVQPPAQQQLQQQQAGPDLVSRQRFAETAQQRAVRAAQERQQNEQRRLQRQQHAQNGSQAAPDVVSTMRLYMERFENALQEGVTGSEPMRPEQAVSEPMRAEQLGAQPMSAQPAGSQPAEAQSEAEEPLGAEPMVTDEVGSGPAAGPTASVLPQTLAESVKQEQPLTAATASEAGAALSPGAVAEVQPLGSGGGASGTSEAQGTAPQDANAAAGASGIGGPGATSGANGASVASGSSGANAASGSDNATAASGSQGGARGAQPGGTRNGSTAAPGGRGGAAPAPEHRAYLRELLPVVQQLETILGGRVVPSLRSTASALEREPQVVDASERAVMERHLQQNGQRLQQMGSLMQELGRVFLSTRLGSTPANAHLHAGQQALFINQYGPNPVMVQSAPPSPSAFPGGAAAAMFGPPGLFQQPSAVNLGPVPPFFMAVPSGAAPAPPNGPSVTAASSAHHVPPLATGVTPVPSFGPGSSPQPSSNLSHEAIVIVDQFGNAHMLATGVPSNRAGQDGGLSQMQPSPGGIGYPSGRPPIYPQQNAQTGTGGAAGSVTAASGARRAAAAVEAVATATSAAAVAAEAAAQAQRQVLFLEADVQAHQTDIHALHFQALAHQARAVEQQARLAAFTSQMQAQQVQPSTQAGAAQGAVRMPSQSPQANPPPSSFAFRFPPSPTPPSSGAQSAQQQPQMPQGAQTPQGQQASQVAQGSQVRTVSDRPVHMHFTGPVTMAPGPPPQSVVPQSVPPAQSGAPPSTLVPPILSSQQQQGYTGAQPANGIMWQILQFALSQQQLSQQLRQYELQLRQHHQQLQDFRSYLLSQAPLNIQQAWSDPQQGQGQQQNSTAGATGAGAPATRAVPDQQGPGEAAGEAGATAGTAGTTGGAGVTAGTGGATAGTGATGTGVGQGGGAGTGAPAVLVQNPTGPAPLPQGGMGVGDGQGLLANTIFNIVHTLVQNPVSNAAGGLAPTQTTAGPQTPTNTTLPPQQPLGQPNVNVSAGSVADIGQLFFPLVHQLGNAIGGAAPHPRQHVPTQHSPPPPPFQAPPAAPPPPAEPMSALPEGSPPAIPGAQSQGGEASGLNSLPGGGGAPSSSALPSDPFAVNPSSGGGSAAAATSSPLGGGGPPATAAKTAGDATPMGLGLGLGLGGGLGPVPRPRRRTAPRPSAAAGPTNPTAANTGVAAPTSAVPLTSLEAGALPAPLWQTLVESSRPGQGPFPPTGLPSAGQESLFSFMQELAGSGAQAGMGSPAGMGILGGSFPQASAGGGPTAGSDPFAGLMQALSGAGMPGGGGGLVDPMAGASPMSAGGFPGGGGGLPGGLGGMIQQMMSNPAVMNMADQMAASMGGGGVGGGGGMQQLDIGSMMAQMMPLVQQTMGEMGVRPDGALGTARGGVRGRRGAAVGGATVDDGEWRQDLSPEEAERWSSQMTADEEAQAAQAAQEPLSDAYLYGSRNSGAEESDQARTGEKEEGEAKEKEKEARRE